MVWPPWNAEWAWGDKRQTLAFWSLGRQNKSAPGWPELLPHLPRTLKIPLLLNPFISSQSVTFAAQPNHSKWGGKKNRATGAPPPDSAQALKMRVDYMLWFPGLLAYAQLEFRTASSSTAIAEKPKLQPGFTRLTTETQRKRNAWTYFALYPQRLVTMHQCPIINQLFDAR